MWIKLHLFYIVCVPCLMCLSSPDADAWHIVSVMPFVVWQPSIRKLLSAASWQGLLCRTLQTLQIQKFSDQKAKQENNTHQLFECTNSNNSNIRILTGKKLKHLQLKDPCLASFSMHLNPCAGCTVEFKLWSLGLLSSLEHIIFVLSFPMVSKVVNLHHNKKYHLYRRVEFWCQNFLNVKQGDKEVKLWQIQPSLALFKMTWCFFCRKVWWLRPPNRYLFGKCHVSRWIQPLSCVHRRAALLDKNSNCVMMNTWLTSYLSS